MRAKYWSNLAVVLALALVMITVGCAKKKISPGPYASGSEGTGTVSRTADESTDAMDRQGVISEESFSEKDSGQDLGPSMPAEDPETIARERIGGEDVYFDFDSAAIKPDAIDTLERKATWMLDNPESRVTIEGHCDERGTNEYNIALGDRRAEAVRSFLIDLGISPQRMTTISYGEERPVAPGSDEASRALNRRVHFVLNP
jgi:peptidoglycan-associated lipoprotein